MHQNPFCFELVGLANYGGKSINSFNSITVEFVDCGSKLWYMQQSCMVFEFNKNRIFENWNLQFYLNLFSFDAP